MSQSKVALFFIPAENACSTSPCQNDGRCVENVGAFACQCQQGWTGRLCEISK